jgi:quercetin dioxygenase-like cupin family protein
MTRRDLAWLLPIAAMAQGAKGGDEMPAHSGVFRFDSLPVHKAANGNETRPVLRGKLPTGEYVEVHETRLQAGQTPHPPHRHKHSEMMLIRDGKMELILEDKTESFGPGDIAFCASGELHGLKNAGTGPANYFVVAIGNDISPS